MGIPTFPRLTDLVTRMEADNVNPVYDAVEAQAMAVLLTDYGQTRVMSGTVSLTDADVPVQGFDCNGANRELRLPLVASTNHAFFIRNMTSSTYKLTVKDSTGTTTIAVLRKGHSQLFVSIGTVWDHADGEVTETGDETLTNKDISSNNNTYRAATEALLGALEIATAAEITTGTDTGRAMCPDQFAGSEYGRRLVEIVVLDNLSSVAVGDGVGSFNFVVPPELDGWNLVDADAAVTTVSSSGTPTFQIANVTDGTDMLSTKITIDANEYTSYSAATQPVINGSYDDVATGDRLRFDCDGAGTGTKGLSIMMAFQKP